jgi:hypothetical protein
MGIEWGSEAIIGLLAIGSLGVVTLVGVPCVIAVGLRDLSLRIRSRQGRSRAAEVVHPSLPLAKVA